MAEPINPMNAPLPNIFCVEIMQHQRNGYAYIRSTREDPVLGQEQVTIIRPANHGNRLFTIINNRQYVLDHVSVWKHTLTRKGSGTVNRSMKWRNTGEALRYDGINYPILKIRAITTSLPVIHQYAFIPIQVDVPAPVPVPVPVPVPAPGPADIKTYLIQSIPQHAIRALLRDAAMQEEVCPITGDDIDITNGAVTSCFHLFDRDAIASWIHMPNSHDKCPVCNTQCTIYLLDENPPGLLLTE